MRIKEDFGQHQPIKFKPREKIRHPEIVRRMNAVLKRMKLTQKELSEKTGIPQSYLSQILNGEKPFSVDHIIKFCKTCNVNLNWLLIGSQGNMFLDSDSLPKKDKDKILNTLKDMNAETAELIKKLMDEE